MSTDLERSKGKGRRRRFWRGVEKMYRFLRVSDAHVVLLSCLFTVVASMPAMPSGC